MLPGISQLAIAESHDDVIKWKHFPRNWPFVRGIHRSRWVPHTKPGTRSFDVFFDLRLNKRLSKQPWGWWFVTLLWPLWRQCNGLWLLAFFVWLGSWWKLVTLDVIELKFHGKRGEMNNLCILEPYRKSINGFNAHQFNTSSSLSLDIPKKSAKYLHMLFLCCDDLLQADCRWLKPALAHWHRVTHIYC